MNTRLSLLAVGFILLAFVACEDSYKQGREAGFSEGWSKGYDDGFARGRTQGHEEGEKDALSRFFPGAKAHLHGAWGAAFRITVFLGAAKVVLALLAAIVYLMHRSTARELAGKIIMSALGTVLILWLSRIIGLSAALRRALLQPVAQTELQWLLRGAGAAAVAYVAIALFRWLFIQTQLGVWADAWCILVMTAILTLTIPVLVDTMVMGPDVNQYISSDILPGVLMGGLFYVAKQLFRKMPSHIREPEVAHTARRLLSR